MGFVRGLAKTAAGLGLVVGSLLGATAGIADAVLEAKHDATATGRVLKRRNPPA
jgi:hypothetical protein